jgi:hypothetical protein
VEFCFLRVHRSFAAGSLALLLTGSLGTSTALAQAAPAAQGAAGAAAPGGTKNYKDRGEYDLFSKVTQTTDPKARLEVLNQWQDKYPQTDFNQERLQYFVATLGALAGADPAQRQPLITKAQDLLKVDANNFTANYYIALYGPAVGGTSPAPDLLTQVDTSAHAVLTGAETNFSADKKPKTMSDDDWAKAKNGVLAIAHNALAWEATQKKDVATAETEYKASLTANPAQGSVSAGMAKMLMDSKDPKKVPDALYEYARASQYDGPGAVPEAGRKQLSDYLKSAYTNFHGGTDGLDQMLAQAKTSPVPPDNFSITNANELAAKQADELNNRINSDPAFKTWYAIKQNVQDKGDAFFNSDVKDAQIPGENQNFSGTIISLDPADKPTKVVLGVEDPAKPDANLEFSQPLPADALDKVKVGQKIEFSGVADSFVKDPYSLTFRDPTIVGVKTTTPARTGRKRR